MGNEKVYGMRFGKIYPLLVNKAEEKGTHSGRSETGDHLADGIHPGRNRKSCGKRSGIRRFFPQCPAAKSRTEADYRCRMRRARGKYRRTADAGNPVSGQTHRRTRQRKGYGKDTA